MSLISEALKEAQRERTERSGPRAASSIVDNIFPYPSRADGGASRRAVILASAAVIVVATGATFGIRWFVHRMSRPAITAPAARPVPARTPTPAVTVVMPPKIVADAGPAVPREPAAHQTPVQKSAAAATAAATTPASKARDVQAPPAPAPVSRVALADSIATKPAAPPVTAPVVQPQGAAAGAGVRIVLDPSGTRPSDSLFAAAYAEHKRGNLEMARDLYEKALRKPPVAPDLYNNYGALLASLNNHTAAIVMYGLGLKVNESDARLWTNLAASYNATGRHAEAMSAYAQAAKLDPTNGVVKTRLAAEYVALGDTSSARRMYDDAARSAPREPAVHYAFGSFLKSQGDVKGAIREFQLFVDLGAASYDAPTIEKMRKYVAALRQANP